MIRLLLFLIVALVIYTVAKGFYTGTMDGDTTLSEVGSAMKEYKAQMVEGVQKMVGRR